MVVWWRCSERINRFYGIILYLARRVSRFQ